MGRAIMKEMQSVPVVDFIPVPTDMEQPSKKVADDLSTDQQLLLKYMNMVSTGNIDVKFVNRAIGNDNYKKTNHFLK